MSSLFRKLLLGLLPATLLAMFLAFRFPMATESLYAQSLYPRIARLFASINTVSFSVAEPLALILCVLGVVSPIFRARKGGRRFVGWLRRGWMVAGVALAGFSLSWGFNYARLPLSQRQNVVVREVSAEAVLEAGERTAERTGALFERLQTNAMPTPLPFTFEELNALIDDGYRSLELEGDPIRFRPTPAKPLWSSRWFSYLGISGIYIPFTGEPSINILQPDPSLPIVVAHEKAHQRGITDEGEANYVAFLVCAQDSSPPYIRYAAFLFATRYLLGAASRTLAPEVIASAWQLAGPGPLEDVRAIYDFWAGYEGPASEVAAEVNDLYLDTMRVPEGIASYGTVVDLLVALDARGELVRP